MDGISYQPFLILWSNDIRKQVIYSIHVAPHTVGSQVVWSHASISDRIFGEVGRGCSHG